MEMSWNLGAESGWGDVLKGKIVTEGLCMKDCAHHQCTCAKAFVESCYISAAHSGVKMSFFYPTSSSSRLCFSSMIHCHFIKS